MTFGDNFGQIGIIWMILVLCCGYLIADLTTTTMTCRKNLQVSTLSIDLEFFDLGEKGGNNLANTNNANESKLKYGIYQKRIFVLF